MYHGYLTKGHFYGGRQVMLQELSFGNDNWIHFKTGSIAKLTQPVPFEGTVQNPVPDFYDDFAGDTLSVKWSWNYPYSTIKARFEYNELLLSGSAKKGNDNGTVLCIRPTSPDYNYDTRVSNSNGSFKGLTMYGDAQNLLAFGNIDDMLIIKIVKDGKEEILHTGSLPVVSPYLRIEVTNGCKGSFCWSKDGKIWNKMETPLDLDMSSLVRWDRVARPGLIHIGPSNETARFSHFNYTNVSAK